jgi:hypothetical protein
MPEIDDPKKNNSFQDPLGLEMFVIEESFEDIFNSLKATYYQRYLSETLKNQPDADKAATFLNRSNEIHRLKNSYHSADWEAKRKAIELYREELKRIHQMK